MGDRQAASGPTTGMSVLRIVTGMTVDEFAAPGAPLLRSTEPIRRAGRASATLAGPAWSCATNGGRFGYGAGGDAARQACSPAFGDVATRAPPGMPADGAYEELVRRSAAAGVRWLAYRPPGMAGSGFADELRAGAAGLWEAQHVHAFVRGIADGTLPEDRFAHYVRQDYVFLVEYARMLALGAARAPDLMTMRRFAELAQEILGEEMELHREFAREFGISEAELEAEPPAPTTQAYTDFLVRTAALGDLGELAAALLPCMWGYAEVGQRLALSDAPPDARYARWIETYACDEFDELARWCRALVDRLAAAANDRGRARMARAFEICSRYELRFWEMGWTLERWPD